MGFFNIYKPKEYKPRFIYYDPKKEAMKEREKQRLHDENLEKDGEFHTSIRRGSFRAMADMNRKTRTDMSKQSNFRVLVILAVLLALAYFLVFY